MTALPQAALTLGATLTANGTLPAGQHTPVDATSAALTVTLPSPTDVGAYLIVEKTDSSTHTVTISGSIRGSSSTVVLYWQYETLELYWTGTTWRPVRGHKPKTALDGAYQVKPSGTGTTSTFLRGDNTWATLPGGGGSGRTAKSKDPSTGWWHFDDWGADKTGATSCATLLQDAITTVLNAGGGTLFVPTGFYNLNGSTIATYINTVGNQEIPFRLLGEPHYSFIDTGAGEYGTVFSKTDGGEMFRVNLDSAGNPASGTDATNGLNYRFDNRFEHFTMVGDKNGSNLVNGIVAYRSRFQLDDISGYYMNSIMYQPHDAIPSGYSGTWQNICDASTYRNIRMRRMKTYGMYLAQPDASVLDGIFYEHPSAAGQYGLYIYWGSGFQISNVLIADLSQLPTGAVSGITLNGCQGVAFSGIHIEQGNFAQIFDVRSCQAITFRGVLDLKVHQSLYNILYTTGVTIAGSATRSTRSSGYYDIKADSTSSDVSYVAMWTGNDASSTSRAISISANAGIVRAL